MVLRTPFWQRSLFDVAKFHSRDGMFLNFIC